MSLWYRHFLFDERCLVLNLKSRGTTRTSIDLRCYRFRLNIPDERARCHVCDFFRFRTQRSNSFSKIYNFIVLLFDQLLKTRGTHEFFHHGLFSTITQRPCQRFSLLRTRVHKKQRRARAERNTSLSLPLCLRSRQNANSTTTTPTHTAAGVKKHFLPTDGK